MTYHLFNKFPIAAPFIIEMHNGWSDTWFPRVFGKGDTFFSDPDEATRKAKSLEVIDKRQRLQYIYRVRDTRDGSVFYNTP